MKIGLISDTHGLLRASAVEALAGVDRLLHAGDVGGAEVLEALEQVAPVTAVRGNTDHGPWCRDLPETQLVEVGESLLYVLHDVARLDLDPAAAGIAAVVFGHSHSPFVGHRGGVLFLNPGAAGHRRFDLPLSVGILNISIAGELSPRIIELSPRPG